MVKKLTLEKAQEWANENTLYTVIDLIRERREDGVLKKIIKARCDNPLHKEFKITWHCFVRGSECPDCRQVKTYKDRLTKNTDYIFINEPLSKYKTHKVKCTCGNIIEATYGSLISSKKCPRCSMKHKIRTNNDFRIEIFEKTNNEYLFLEDFKGVNSHILCRHNKCGYIWKVLPSSILHQNTGCPKCNGGVRKTSSEFVERVLKDVGDEYTVLREYKNVHTPVLMRHNTCGNEWRVQPAHFLHSKTRCPKCSSSKGEKSVAKELANSGIKFQTQYKFEDCFFDKKRKLRFDFAIFNKDNELLLLIEYDGIQHFKPTRFNGIPLERAEKIFGKTKQCDLIKNTYCKNNNIKLLRISYKEYKDIPQIISMIKI